MHNGVETYFEITELRGGLPGSVVRHYKDLQEQEDTLKKLLAPNIQSLTHKIQFSYGDVEQTVIDRIIIPRTDHTLKYLNAKWEFDVLYHLTYTNALESEYGITWRNIYGRTVRP